MCVCVCVRSHTSLQDEGFILHPVSPSSSFIERIRRLIALSYLPLFKFIFLHLFILLFKKINNLNIIIIIIYNGNLIIIILFLNLFNFNLN